MVPCPQRTHNYTEETTPTATGKLPCWGEERVALPLRNIRGAPLEKISRFAQLARVIHCSSAQQTKDLPGKIRGCWTSVVRLHGISPAKVYKADLM